MPHIMELAILSGVQLGIRIFGSRQLSVRAKRCLCMVWGNDLHVFVCETLLKESKIGGRGAGVYFLYSGVYGLFDFRLNCNMLCG